MQRNIFFNISTYTTDLSTFPKPEDDRYDYWQPLATYFLGKSNTIEFHCWDEEVDTIEELMKLDSLEVSEQENMTIFKGMKTPILIDFLLNHYFNPDGEFKWFTVNFDYGSNDVFHAGHWATEFFVPNVEEKEIEFIKSVVPLETSLQEC